MLIGRASFMYTGCTTYGENGIKERLHEIHLTPYISGEINDWLTDLFNTNLTAIIICGIQHNNQFKAKLKSNPI